MGGGGFLGLGPAPQAPAAPDYTGAAQATAAGNLQAAQTQTAANRVNQVTPYGNLDYTQSGTDSAGNPMWTATTSLSPTGQSLLDYQNQTSGQLAGLLGTQFGNVSQSINQGFNPNTNSIAYGANASTPMVSSANAPNQLTTSVPSAGDISRGVSPVDYQMMGKGPGLQTQVGGTGMQGWDQATALINSRLQPQIAHQNEMSDAQLANQGIVPGSEAYANAKRVLSQGQNDLLTQAQLAGQQVQQNMFGQNLAAGQFGNTAQNQMYSNALAGTQANNAALANTFGNAVTNAQLQNTGQQQQFGQSLANAQLGNAANAQGFGQSLSNAQLANLVNQQQFGQSAQNAALNNAAQQQAYNQSMTNYQLPLNMLNALRTGSQVTNPTFGAVPQQAGTAGADLLGATQLGSNYNLAGFNAANASQAGLNSGLFGLGAAGIMAMSDIRMKENITKIGQMPNGLNVYEFEYKPEFKNHPFANRGKNIGYMAQEVKKVAPYAVIENADGYLMINYGVL